MKFTITADDSSVVLITLENVLYLPESAKNIISTSKWSEDMDDNCAMFSREKYTIFTGIMMPKLRLSSMRLVARSH